MNPRIVKPEPQSPVRGEFKLKPSSEQMLRSRTKVSTQVVLRGNNAVPPIEVGPRNLVSRAHNLVVGDSVTARMATRNREQRVVLCGESGKVAALYRSGRINVLWSGGGSGWYTIAELRQKGVRGP